MPKIVDKAQMQRKILDATVKAFTKYGFHKATMEQIAKEAGIAKGTLYLYFDSKEALSIAFAQSYFFHMEGWMRKQGKAETLKDFIDNIRESLLIGPEQARFIPVFFEAFGPSFHSKEFTETIGGYFDSMGKFYTENLDDLKAKGEIRQEMDTASFGRVLISMLDGILLHYGFFSHTEHAYEKMVDEALKAIYYGLNSPYVGKRR